MKASAAAVWLAVASAVAVLGAGVPARANGDVQREIRGTVVSVDARAGTLVVSREFRGKTSHVTLRASTGTPVLSCSDERATFDQVKTGMAVSVFYEVLGSEGVANVVVLEPSR
jgi:hypothetical protein